MDEFAPGNPFQKVQKSTLHAIDPIPFLQTSEPVGAAAGAAAMRSQVVCVRTHYGSFGIAVQAFVNGQVLESLPKGPVHTPQMGAALAAFNCHFWPCYSANCGSGTRSVTMED
jgi:hypothetical protein